GARPAARAERTGDRMPRRDALEHMIAVTYGVSYDAVVTHFSPYESMLEEIVAFVGRSVPDPTEPRATRVLDVACGIGNVSPRVRPGGSTLSFQHFDIANAALPGAGSFDVLVSMHTLYWHPDPDALLQGCRRA